MLVRRAIAFTLLVSLTAFGASLQDEPGKKDDAKAAVMKLPDAKAIRVLFESERAEAVKAQFPPDTLTAADDLAKRGESALDANDAKAAARYFRDARWQLPYVPRHLPPNVVRVLGEGRLRHADRVNAVGYSPDGTRIVSASRDGTVKVWDLGNGREIAVYRGHLDQPDDPTRGANVLRTAEAAFSPTESVIASVSGSQVHLWDPETGKLVKVLLNLEKADKPLKSLAFSPDGKRLAVGGDDGILRVIEVATGKELYASPSRNARIENVAFSPNGKLIAVVDSGGKTPGNVAVYVPGGSNPMPMSVQAVEHGEALGVAFNKDGTSVFTAGRDGRPRLTAATSETGDQVPATSSKLREYVGHSKAVFALAVTPDGKFLVTGGEDRTVRVWEIGSGKQIRVFPGHLDRVISVAVRPDGKQIASGSDDGAVRLWDLNTSDDHLAMQEATDPLWAVAFSPNGKRAAAVGADKLVRIYDPSTGKLEATLPGHKAPITSAAFFPDNNRLVTAGGDRVLKIWDVAAKKSLKDVPAHDSAILTLAVSEDGKSIVSGSADRTVRAWNPEDGKELWSWTGKSAVCGVAIRKGGPQVAVGLADGNLVVLDLASGKPKELSTANAHVAGVASVVYSPDGNRIATVGGDGAARVWAVAENGTPSQLVKFEGQPKAGSSTGFYPLTGVAFSPDGRFIATAGADAIVRVWDIQTKTEARSLRGQTDWTTSVAFSPDGQWLATAGVDHSVRIFEMARDETSPPSGHLLAVTAVAVSPDGKVVATASRDRTIKLWEIATGREVGTLVGNIGESETPYALGFLGNDALVVGTAIRSGTPPGNLHYWNTKPGRQIRVVPTGSVYNLVTAKDGSRLAALTIRPAIGEEAKNSAYELYDRDGALLGVVKDQGRNVKAVNFTPDLGWAVSGDDTGGVYIWDLAKKERVGANWALFANEIADVGVTPDRKLLVALDRKGLVKVADVDKRETLASTQAHNDGVTALVVSPTGEAFITIGADREVKAWSLKDLKALKETRTWQIPATVNGATFTPDGKFVITANGDGTAYVLAMP